MMSQNTIIFIPVLPWLDPLLLYCKFGFWQLFFFFFFAEAQDKDVQQGAPPLPAFISPAPSFFYTATSFVPHYPSISPSGILEGAWRVCCHHVTPERLRCELLPSHVLDSDSNSSCVSEKDQSGTRAITESCLGFHLHINSIKGWSTGSWDHKVLVRCSESWVGPANRAMLWLDSFDQSQRYVYPYLGVRASVFLQWYGHIRAMPQLDFGIFKKNVWRRLNSWGSNQ